MPKWRQSHVSSLLFFAFRRLARLSSPPFALTHTRNRSIREEENLLKSLSLRAPIVTHFECDREKRRVRTLCRHLFSLGSTKNLLPRCVCHVSLKCPSSCWLENWRSPFLTREFLRTLRVPLVINFHLINPLLLHHSCIVRGN